MNLNIEIIADVVCPWCFIGKRRLDVALNMYRSEGRGTPVVHWRPYQLNAGIPEGGVDRHSFLIAQFGEAGLSRVNTRVSTIGRQVDIQFAFEKISRQPNTLAAHCLIALAESYGRQHELVEIFFNAFFVGGLDLSSEAVLQRLAVMAGLPEVAVIAALASNEVRRNVAADEKQVRTLGVQGVPLYIFNRRTVISGAQEPDTLLRAMQIAGNAEAAA